MERTVRELWAGFRARDLLQIVSGQEGIEISDAGGKQTHQATSAI